MIGKCCNGLIAARRSVKPKSVPAQKCDLCAGGAGAVTVRASVGAVAVMTGFRCCRQKPTQARCQETIYDKSKLYRLSAEADGKFCRGHISAGEHARAPIRPKRLPPARRP